MRVWKGVKKPITLVREWRCWREDGSYQGPCTEMMLRNWPNKWAIHHLDFCGWQWSVMEREM